MHIKNIIDMKRWRKFLEEYNCKSIFLTPEMYAFYKKNSKIEPLLLVVEKKRKILGIALGEISWEGLNFFGFNKRTIFYVEPFYNGNLEVLRLLLEEIKKKAQGLFVQIRPNRILTETEKKVFKQAGYRNHDHLDAKIQLTSKDTLWKNIGKDKRKGIKHAENRYGLDVKELTNPAGVELFYNFIKELYNRKRHPLKDIEYFHKTLNSFNNNFRYFFVFDKNLPIATQLIIDYKKTITAYYTATKKEHKKKRAGDLLIWKILELGLKENYEIFDFGGGGNPHIDYGPGNYKKRFGTVFQNVERYDFPLSKLYYPIMKIYRAFLKN